MRASEIPELDISDLQLETEEDFYLLLETLGGARYMMNRAVNKGHTPDDEQTKRALEEIAHKSQQVLSLLEEKFGVLHPAKTPKVEWGEELPAPPEGKRWYRPWYLQMKEANLRKLYSEHICSGCALSEGFGSFAWRIPCSVRDGINRLIHPSICYLLHYDWTPEQLRAKLLEVGGPEGVATFQAKEEELNTHESFRI